MILTQLTRDYPLIEGWTPVEKFEETTVLEGVPVRLVGLFSQHEKYGSVFGSGAELADDPTSRAYFELIERISAAEYRGQASDQCQLVNIHGNPAGRAPWDEIFPKSPSPENWEFSRSNGIGAGRIWSDACESAMRELLERDAILRSFFAGVRPQLVETARANEDFGLPCASHEWSLMEFPSRAGWTVLGWFGFPRQGVARPFVCGFGAGRSLEEARGRAFRETLQRLGFLWDEAQPESSPENKCTPDFHQEYYLYRGNHEILRDWLFRSPADPRTELPREPAPVIQFCNLTPAIYQNKLFVAKAHSPELLRLFFGKDGPVELQGFTLERRSLIHPVA